MEVSEKGPEVVVGLEAEGEDSFIIEDDGEDDFMVDDNLDDVYIQEDDEDGGIGDREGGNAGGGDSEGEEEDEIDVKIKEEYAKFQQEREEKSRSRPNTASRASSPSTDVQRQRSAERAAERVRSSERAAQSNLSSSSGAVGGVGPDGATSPEQILSQRQTYVPPQDRPWSAGVRTALKSVYEADEGGAEDMMMREQWEEKGAVSRLATLPSGRMYEGGGENVSDSDIIVSSVADCSANDYDACDETVLGKPISLDSPPPPPPPPPSTLTEGEDVELRKADQGESSGQLQQQEEQQQEPAHTMRIASGDTAASPPPGGDEEKVSTPPPKRWMSEENRDPELFEMREAAGVSAPIDDPSSRPPPPPKESIRKAPAAASTDKTTPPKVNFSSKKKSINNNKQAISTSLPSRRPVTAPLSRVSQPKKTALDKRTPLKTRPLSSLPRRVAKPPPPAGSSHFHIGRNSQHLQNRFRRPFSACNPIAKKPTQKEEDLIAGRSNIDVGLVIPFEYKDKLKQAQRRAATAGKDRPQTLASGINISPVNWGILANGSFLEMVQDANNISRTLNLRRRYRLVLKSQKLASVEAYEVGKVNKVMQTYMVETFVKSYERLKLCLRRVQRDERIEETTAPAKKT